MWWLSIIGFFKNLSTKQLAILVGALAFLGLEYGIFYAGERHAFAKVNAANVVSITKETKKEREEAKDAVKAADEASDKLNDVDSTNKANEAKAHELSKDSNCPKSDAEREFLRKRVDDANKNK